MRKIHSYFILLLLMLCSVSVLAQTVADGYYRIRVGATPDFAWENAGKVVIRTNAANPETGAAGDLSEMWHIQAKSTGGYSITNVATGKEVIAPSANDIPHSTGTTGSTFYIKAPDNDASLRVISPQSSFSGQTCWHKDARGNVVRWSSDAANSQWRFIPITDEAELTIIRNAAPIRLAAEFLGTRKVFSIKNQNGLYLSQGEGDAVTLTASPQNTSQAHLWIVDNATGKYVIRNAQSLKVLTLASTTTTSATISYSYIKQSAAGSPYMTIASGGLFADGTCLSVSGSNVILANASASSPTTSDWTFELSSQTFNDVMNALFAEQERVYAPTSGAYYRIVNRYYPDKSLVHFMGATTLNATTTSQTDYSQIWRLEGSGTTWALKNILTEQYAQNNSGRSVPFTSGASPSNFTLRRPNEFSSEVSFQAATGQGLHSNASFNIVGYNWDSEASQWYLQPVEITAPMQTDIEAIRSSVSDFQVNRENYNQRLLTLFTDATCTELKSEYQSMAEAEFQAAISSLPAPLQQMALRVKKDTWNSNNTTANALEKGFRIATYAPTSNPSLWSSKLKMTYAFSRLVNPTGITGEAGQIVYLYVQEVPANCSVKLELVSGFSTTGMLFDLQQGVNAIFLPYKGHLYLSYTIDNVDIKLADRPNIKVHIEGGRANGYFDASRHTNADWTAMRNLSGEGFFQDAEIRLKAKRHNNYVLHKMPHVNTRNEAQEGLFQVEDRGEWIYNGVYYGVAGVLEKHQQHVQWQHDLIALNEYYDYFNCRFTAMSNSEMGFPYAHLYGTYYTGVGNYMSYAKFTKGWENDEGEPIWVWAHENGHLHQAPINFGGMTEVSVNLFSQISAWNRGSSVTRGVSLKNAMNKFQNKTFYSDYDGSEMMRMYWQLYLYYHVLGHKPDFYPEVFKRLRNSPMTRSSNEAAPGSGDTDYLKFARICADVAGEDLSEFFEFYGFFIPVTNKKIQDKPYPRYNYITTTQDEITATKAYMAQYPTKRANLLFIDDRIELTPATNDDLIIGTMRHASSAAATPGVATEVGDVGMYTLFASDAPAVAVSAVRQNGSTFEMRATNAVGYKVYDATGALVFVSNDNTFTIPGSVDITGITIKVGGGNGDEITVVENGQILSQYTNVTEPYNYRHGLAVAISEDAIDTPYVIQNAGNESYYVTANSASTTTKTSAGRFALIDSEVGELVYIYNIDERKWFTYSDLSGGANKVSLVDNKAEAKMWKIVPEDVTKTRFDVYPYDATTKTFGVGPWNWNGGAQSNKRMGFFSVGTDNMSSWRFHSLTSPLQEAEAALAGTGIGYPKMDATTRTVLQQKVDEAKNIAKTDFTFVMADGLKTALEAFKNDADVQLPQDGKVYRVRNRLDGRFIANAPTMEGTTERTLSMSGATDNTTLWVAQTDGTTNLLASGTGNAYMARLSDAERGAATSTYDGNSHLVFAKGSQLGTLSIRANGLPLGAEYRVDHLSGTANFSWSAPNFTTDFYFDEVSDFSFPINFTEGTNGIFATTYLPFAVTLPQGVTANNLQVSGSEAYDLVSLSGNVLPARTAVVLKAEQAGIQQFVPTASLPTISTILSGTITRIANSDLDFTRNNYYALARNAATNEIVLRIIGSANIPANRAYLAVPKTGTSYTLPSYRLMDAGTTSLIPTKRVEEVNGAVYDLAGRRVETLQRGKIYVREGKVFIAK